MRKMSMLAIVLCLISTGSYAAPFQDGDVVVFFGDSITHGGQYHTYMADYYATRFPESRIRLVNSGIGGDTASGAFKRIPEDVAEYEPTHVVFHFGMNDVGRRFYTAEPSADMLIAREQAQVDYRSSLRKLVDGVRKAAPKAKFVYLTPTPYEDVAIVTNAPATGWASVNQVGCNLGLSLMAGFVLRMAKSDKVNAVDWYSILNLFRVRHQKTDPHFSFVYPDRVHPNRLGHSIMAWTFLKSQGVPSVVSDVMVDATVGRIVSAENAILTGLACGRDYVSFELLSKALPMPVCPEARPFVEEFDVERTLNSEVVTVKGLADGVYELTIDGEKIGLYSSDQFASGIHLGFNERTPQYRQAQAVAKRRAELSVRESVLRNHHSARWFFSGRAPIDDISAFRSWYENDIKCGGKNANSYYGKFIPGYIEYWPIHRMVREALWKDQEALSAMAKPVPHSYLIKRR